MSFTLKTLKSPEIISICNEFTATELEEIAIKEATEAAARFALRSCITSFLEISIAALNVLDIVLIVVFVIAFIYDLVDPEGFNKLRYREQYEEIHKSSYKILEVKFLESVKFTLLENEEFPMDLNFLMFCTPMKKLNQKNRNH